MSKAEFSCLRQVARLFLVSDILHNSTAPVRNASRYRSLLEDTLPDIFQSLQARSASPCLRSSSLM
jgi:U2-associated protein SR140